MNKISEKKVLSAVIADKKSNFKGFGCNLVVPFMGTHWNREDPKNDKDLVQISSAAGTFIHNKLFNEIGGYDDGMIIYGAAEPEFSLRIWLNGGIIELVNSIYVFHKFKNESEIK